MASWFSVVRVHQRVFEVKEEVVIFVTDNNRDEANDTKRQDYCINEKIRIVNDEFEK